MKLSKNACCELLVLREGENLEAVKLLAPRCCEW
jgi:hypothetical protein